MRCFGMDSEAAVDERWQGENDDGPGVLFDAIEGSLRRGDIEAALGLLGSVRRRFAVPVSAAATNDSPLTEREAAALALLPDASLSQKDMARVLGISHNTLKTHLRSVYQKLGAHSRGEAIERTSGGGRAVTGRRHLAAV